ncbi:hypothetical protein [Rummeliibacillus suwonensis]|uniref:hypothetical protein n=1 Tax=Rummeliibacillus suwonensis TaxID=1306154 RepID=UPI0011B4766A|nr:hypothetical protein [Rummeliibacillus suwonensis]
MANTQEVRGIAYIILGGDGQTFVLDTECSGNITSQYVADTITYALANNINTVTFGGTTVDVGRVWKVRDIETQQEFIINEANKLEPVEIKDFSNEDIFHFLFQSIEEIEDKKENEFANELMEELYDRYYKSKLN